MNIPTLIILLVIAGLLALSLRRIFKKGSCNCASPDASGGCPGCGQCATHGQCGENQPGTAHK